MKQSNALPKEHVMQLRVLIVEDDASVAEAIGSALHTNGMATERAASGAEATEKINQFEPHVALIDLALPDTNGIDLIKQLKAKHNCGIIIVTGNMAEAERIVGLEVGADDYLNKPPPLRELVARIRAVHRRVSSATAAAPDERGRAQPARRIFRVGATNVDLELSRVTDSDGRNVALTGTEFEVLRMLLLADGKAVSRQGISSEVLHRPWRAEDRSVDQLIYQIRSKLLPDDKDHTVMQTMRNEGYRLVAQQEP